MTPCLKCGREILVATVLKPEGGGYHLTLNATPTTDGEWATWTIRDGLAWILRARPAEYEDRLLGRHLLAPHACEPVGEQMRLGA